jgi:hypothetical protein
MVAIAQVTQLIPLDTLVLKPTNSLSSATMTSNLQADQLTALLYMKIECTFMEDG